MTDRVKYPRTMHLPWSPGVQNDDRVIKTLAQLDGEQVVVTEKLDGENTTLYRDGLHARSADGRHHPSRDWVKRFWGENQWRIPPDTRICGENLYAQHSVAYDNLETYFYAFGVWSAGECLSWNDTEVLLKEYGITPVPVLWQGTFSESNMQRIADAMDFEQQEGYVVRLARSFKHYEFPSVVAKYVREGHVQTDKHWMHSEIIPNKLAERG